MIDTILKEAVQEGLYLLGFIRTRVACTDKEVTIIQARTFTTPEKCYTLQRREVERIIRYGRICTGDLRRLMEKPPPPPPSSIAHQITRQRLKNFRRKYGPHITAEHLPGAKDE